MSKYNEILDLSSLVLERKNESDFNDLLEELISKLINDFDYDFETNKDSVKTLFKITEKEKLLEILRDGSVQEGAFAIGIFRYLIWAENIKFNPYEGNFKEFSKLSSDLIIKN